jgi:hypothetical protein
MSIKNIMKKFFLKYVGVNTWFILFLALIFTHQGVSQEIQNYKELSGIILSLNTSKPLDAASVIIKDTNISSITNTEGAFTLKIPEANMSGGIIISYLGYNSKEVKISTLSEKGNRILLESKITYLSDVNILSFKDPEGLVRAIFDKKAINNPTEPTYMTAFYRETIKRRNRNVSLTEAVVNLYKQSYSSTKQDIVIINKARKSTDYRRLDTIGFKLQGGPFSTLFLDIMKYPEYIFTAASIGNYSYNFEPPTAVNGKPVYVVRFEQRKDIREPLYKGVLYIDASSLALTNADYSLNVENKKQAANLFVERKPRNVKVLPMKADYHVDYREKDGKWHYSYGSVALTFKVTRKGKLFNSVYSLGAEMAITNSEGGAQDTKGKYRNRLKPSVILSDAISGFSDEDFWGAYNVIEPDKSIESAINKIQKKLKRSGS